jgi:hypothetical protein
VTAAVLVDDLDLDRRHIERLLDDAPGCRVVIASPNLTLLNGSDVALGGLDHDSAAELVTARLGRDLTSEERRAVEQFANASGGQPLALVLATAAVRREAIQLSGLSDGVEAVAAALGDSLDLAERRALGVLKSVRGAPLPAEAVGAAATIDQPQRVLDGLRDDGIVQSASPRFRLPEDVGSALQLPDTRAQTLAGLTGWSRGITDPEALVGAGAALVEIAAWGRHHQPEATVGLARAAHAGLFLGGAWTTWSDLLTAADSAAASPFDKAWTLHELGTRDLLLGDASSASIRLHEALDLRVRIGDEEGASATRHNLDLLEGPPPPRDDGGGDGDGGGNGHHFGRWFAGVLTAAVVVGGALYATGVLLPDGDDDGGNDDNGTTESTVAPTVAPGSLDTGTDRLELGEVVVGGESEALWTVVNRGPGAVEVFGAGVDPPFEAHEDCGTLEALDQCEMTVHFNPDAPGQYESELVVEHSGEGSPLVATVTGSAVEPPEAFLSAIPANLDFGSHLLDEADREQVEIRNDGNTPVDSIDPFLVDEAFFSYESDCSSLAPGESCSVLVFFPSSEPGVFEDLLVVDHSGDNSPVEIPVRGEVMMPPDVVGEVVDWGTADGSWTSGDFTYYPLPVTLLIANIGGEPAPDPFRIHMETVEDGPQWIPSGPGPDDFGNVLVEGGLGPGGSVEVPVFVFFDVETYEIGQEVPLRVVVDSCFAEEFIEDPPCRVAEGPGEENNASEPTPVVIDVEFVVE